MAFFLSSCSEGEIDLKSNSQKEREIVSEGFEQSAPPNSQEIGPDPLFINSWHLVNSGQKSFARESGELGEDVGLGMLHQDGIQGEGIKLAFSDNGHELTHPELWFNRLKGMSRNYSSSFSDKWHNKNPTPLGERSVHAHGTSVAGLAVASADNYIGSKGLAPRAKFAGFLYVGVANSYDKMLDQAHGDFDIFNYSYGRNSCRFNRVSSSYIDQLQYGVNELRGGLGAVYVKAAGNEFIGLRSECSEQDKEAFYFGNVALEREHSSPYMIVVGANNARGKSASYSTPGPALWVTAPGGEFGDLYPALVGPDLMGCHRGSSQSGDQVNDFEEGKHFENESCDYTSTMNGTSASTPLVSATVALMLEVNPDLSWREVKLILAQTARKIDPFLGPTRHPIYVGLEGHTYQRGWVQNAAGFNFHNWYGLGAVDASEAVKVARNYQGGLPKLQQTLKADGDWKYETAQNLGLEVPDADSQGVESEIFVAEDLTIEAVQIRLSVEHTFASDLGVELTSPSGTVSQLMTINSGIVEKSLDNVLLLSNAFLGEGSKGSWTLKVIDGAQNDLGVLKNWKVNIWGHSPSSNPSTPSSFLLSKNDTNPLTSKPSPEGMVLKLNQKDIQTAQRSPGFPKLSGSPGRSAVAPKTALTKKILNTAGSISYEWKTYNFEIMDKKEELKKFNLIDFIINPELKVRLEVLANEKNIRLMQRSIESGQLKWSRSFSLPENQIVFGSIWAEENTVIIASRDPQGRVFFWEINEQEPISVTKKIDTKILSRLTKAKTILLNNETYLLVWDDYFLHRWFYQEEQEKISLKPVSFQGEQILSVFEDKKQIYAWTKNKQEAKLWKIDGDESFLINKTKIEFEDNVLMPLSKESFLTLDSERNLWLRLSTKGDERKEKLPGMTSLFDKTDIHIQSEPEGEILVLWGYEEKSQLFHEFKFYLEGLNDEK